MRHDEYTEQVTDTRIEHVVEEGIFVWPYHEREDPESEGLSGE